MDNSQPFGFANRGPSSLVRLVFFTSLSLFLIFVDLRYHSLESTRKTLSVFVSPIQQLAILPGTLWRQMRERLYTQTSLVRENTLLSKQHQNDLATLLKLRALEAETQKLRSLAALPPPQNYQSQMAEVIYAERDVFKRKVVVNKGSSTGVEAGQVVMDSDGIVGQITRVYPWAAEVTLITDKDQAVPVQVSGGGLRTILQGAGDTSKLTIRYLSTNALIKVNDLLITSGLDGVYPAGIPVAKVTKVERNPAYPFAQIECAPVAGVDNHRHLLILSTLPKLPDLPVQPVVVEKPSKPKRKK